MLQALLLASSLCFSAAGPSTGGVQVRDIPSVPAVAHQPLRCTYAAPASLSRSASGHFPGACPSAANSSKSLLARLIHRLKVERKENRNNLRRAHQYYNPLRVVYQVLGL